MDLFKQLGFLVVFFIEISHSTSSPGSIHTISAKDVYRRHNDQGYHSSFLNIEEGLRKVESIHYSVKRHEITLERILNKVDAIDSRTARMQTVIQMKLEALSQTVTATELKNEWILDQVRKYESSHDRLSMKLNSVESKIEDVVRKTQASHDAFFDKLGNKHDNMEEKIKDLATTASNLRHHSNSIEMNANKSNDDVMNKLKAIEDKLAKNDEFEKITSRLNGIHHHLNRSDSMWTQNDGPLISDKEKMIDYIKKELSSESQKLGNKMSNMYHELWKKIGIMEGVVKDGFTDSNITQRIIVDDLKNLLIEQRDSEGFIDISIERVLSIINKRFNDLQRKQDDNFDNIASAQSVFMETCHRIQEDEPELESRVTEVLEKILDVFTNRTVRIEKEMRELLETLKKHHSQIARMTLRNTHVATSLSNSTRDDHKYLDYSILEVAERADLITLTIQEMQGKMNEFIETNRAVHNLPKNKEVHFSIPDDMEKNVNKIEEKPPEVNEIEAHYGDGVLKILTDQDLNNTKLVNSSDSTSTELDYLSKLNKTITTKDINAIFGHLPKNETVPLETQVHNNPQRKKDFENSLITEEISTQLMLSYIKLIRDKITIKEFLTEKLTGRSYDSLTDMIQHLKPIDTIPREFITELDQYENRLKLDKIYSHENEDDTFNYDDFALPN